LVYFIILPNARITYTGHNARTEEGLQRIEILRRGGMKRPRPRLGSSAEGEAEPK
jgi:hypothetical protein